MIKTVTLNASIDKAYHMTEKIEKGMDQGIEVNLTGYQYRDRKGTQYTVLRHSKDDLKIEVLNRRALK